ncbi:hypothetical protein IE81DRAFT_341411 [Ceraceosorus guamensis]|uniref:Uncharacterized protein n=1 Tax=Ceraceosorus guamensis TaxID=1522189 RepID=A0A316VY22_9BASI|nr:hypothetical protein IE81DRAFT_341411 [Ceraceosorus guamensis]PWN42526.1 hypothetical protein IE81DRAFT_341411 [Ceraceosorus guamensis]
METPRGSAGDRESQLGSRDATPSTASWQVEDSAELAYRAIERSDNRQGQSPDKAHDTGTAGGSAGERAASASSLREGDSAEHASPGVSSSDARARPRPSAKAKGESAASTETSEFDRSEAVARRQAGQRRAEQSGGEVRRRTARDTPSSAREQEQQTLDSQHHGRLNAHPPEDDHRRGSDAQSPSHRSQAASDASVSSVEAPLAQGLPQSHPNAQRGTPPYESQRDALADRQLDENKQEGSHGSPRQRSWERPPGGETSPETYQTKHGGNSRSTAEGRGSRERDQRDPESLRTESAELRGSASHNDRREAPEGEWTSEVPTKYGKAADGGQPRLTRALSPPRHYRPRTPGSREQTPLNIQAVPGQSYPYVDDARDLEPAEVDKFLSLIEKHNLDASDEEDMARSVTELYSEWIDWCIHYRITSTKSKPALVSEFVKVHQGVYGVERQRRAMGIVQGSRAQPSASKGHQGLLEDRGDGQGPRQVFAPAVQSPALMSTTFAREEQHLADSSSPRFADARRGPGNGNVQSATPSGERRAPRYASTWNVPPPGRGYEGSAQQPVGAERSLAAQPSRSSSVRDYTPGRRDPEAAAERHVPPDIDPRARSFYGPPPEGLSRLARPHGHPESSTARGDMKPYKHVSDPSQNFTRPSVPLSTVPDHSRASATGGYQAAPSSSRAPITDATAGPPMKQLPPGLFDQMRAALRDEILGEARRNVDHHVMRLSNLNKDLVAHNEALKARVEQLEIQSDNAAKWITYLAQSQDDSTARLDALSASATAQARVVPRDVHPSPHLSGSHHPGSEARPARTSGGYITESPRARTRQVEPPIYKDVSGESYRAHNGDRGRHHEEEARRDRVVTAAPPASMPPREYQRRAYETEAMGETNASALSIAGSFGQRAALDFDQRATALSTLSRSLAKAAL